MAASVLVWKMMSIDLTRRSQHPLTIISLQGIGSSKTTGRNAARVKRDNVTLGDSRPRSTGDDESDDREQTKEFDLHRDELGFKRKWLDTKRCRRV
jgi:hypothetical protein